MPVPLLDLTHQHTALWPQLAGAFERVVASGQLILGPEVEAFEHRLAAYCGAQHAVGVSSGTDALLVALMALGIGPGDEVITTPFTFFATAGCIVRVGAKPVFVDIEPDTFNLDPTKIEAAITPSTRAIIPVHLYGQPAAMGRIMPLAAKHGLKVIEDAAQAIGARVEGKHVGTIGDIGCLSFYPTKNLSALGDAGACVTNDPGLASRLVSLRVHGQGSDRYRHDRVGGNFRLDAIQAAMLTIKLTQLDAWTQHRRTVAQRYHDLLTSLPITPPQPAPGFDHVYHQYTIRVDQARRDALGQHLHDQGIGHAVYYPTPLHLQPCFADLRCGPGQLPSAEQAAKEVLSLPIYPGLSKPQQEEVASAIQAFLTSDL